VKRETAVTALACGTYGKYMWHHNHGEPQDDACIAAARWYGQGYRLRTSVKCSKGLGWPVREARRPSRAGA